VSLTGGSGYTNLSAYSSYNHSTADPKATFADISYPATVRARLSPLVSAAGLAWLVARTAEIGW
jgi:hypothetical protein